MTIERWASLLHALREPAAMAGFDLPTWDRVARQAAAAGLTARLGALAQQAGVQQRLPIAVWRQMQAALTIAAQQQRAVHWELAQLAHTLAALPGPVVLLKGAAYVAADAPPATGRLFSDLDLLVPRPQLGAAEAALMRDGWAGPPPSTYDQRYYRRWMHELPPMTHLRRGTVLDVHHAIVPPTARLRTDAGPIVADARPLPGLRGFCVPTPIDLVLHSATHRFHEGEWDRGLRDLVDLDALLRDGARETHFWPRLLARAAQLHLGRPLFHGLRSALRLLATPVPDEVIDRCPQRPSAPFGRAMEGLFVNACTAAHPPSRSAAAGAASVALYLRSHWLRMPLHLLLPHLAYKSWIACRGRRRPVAAMPAADDQPVFDAAA